MFQRPVYRTSLVLTTLAAVAGAAQLIDINAASPAELADALPGIGPVLSERIVGYREANGPFLRRPPVAARGRAPRRSRC